MLDQKIQGATDFKKHSNQQRIPATFPLSLCSMNMGILLKLAVSILKIQKRNQLPDEMIDNVWHLHSQRRRGDQLHTYV
jgi:hypothetical protein